MTDYNRDIFCLRCKARPCGCPHVEFDPDFAPLEHERPMFEDYMREVHPERSLDRWGCTYKDGKTRDRWMGWQACARRVVTVAVRRVRDAS